MPIACVRGVAFSHGNAQAVANKFNLSQYPFINGIGVRKDKRNGYVVILGVRNTEDYYKASNLLDDLLLRSSFLDDVPAMPIHIRLH